MTAAPGDAPGVSVPRARVRGLAVCALLLALCGLCGGAVPAPAASLTAVLPAGGDLGAGASALVAADDVLYLLARTSGDVRAFPLHGMLRAEQFTKVLRRKEGLAGLIIGQPISLAMAGSDLYILDDLASLFVYHPHQDVKALVGLRVETRQGTLQAIAFPRGAAQLDVLSTTPGAGHPHLWAYRRATRGYLNAPRALPLPGTLAGASPDLAAVVPDNGVVLTTAAGAVVYWPGSTRRAVSLLAGSGGPAAAVGAVWTPTPVSSATILLLSGARSTVDAWRISTGGHVVPLPPLRFAPPRPRSSWQAIAGDAVSARLYLLDTRGRVFSLPVPSAWQTTTRP